MKIISSEALCDMIESCICERSYTELAKAKKILIIGTNVMSLFVKAYHRIRDINSNAQIYIVAQPQMKEGIDEIIDTNCNVIDWSGPYTLEMITQLKAEIEVESLDAFIFFSAQAMNLRDCNLMEIASKLQKVNGFKIYCIDFADELCEYTDIDVCFYGLQLYLALEHYVEIKC